MRLLEAAAIVALAAGGYALVQGLLDRTAAEVSRARARIVAARISADADTIAGGLPWNVSADEAIDLAARADLSVSEAAVRIHRRRARQRLTDALTSPLATDPARRSRP